MNVEMVEEIRECLNKLGTYSYMRDRHPEAPYHGVTLIPVKIQQGDGPSKSGWHIHMDAFYRDHAYGCSAIIMEKEWGSKFSFPEKLDLVRQRTREAFKQEKKIKHLDLCGVCSHFDKSRVARAI